MYCSDFEDFSSLDEGFGSVEPYFGAK